MQFPSVHACRVSTGVTRVGPMRRGRETRPPSVPPLSAEEHPRGRRCFWIHGDVQSSSGPRVRAWSRKMDASARKSRGGHHVQACAFCRSARWASSTVATTTAGVHELSPRYVPNTKWVAQRDWRSCGQRQDWVRDRRRSPSVHVGPL